MDREDLTGDEVEDDGLLLAFRTVNEDPDARDAEECLCLIAVNGSSSLLSDDSLSSSAIALDKLLE